MITELLIENPERTPCAWWPKVEAYRGLEKFEFNPKGLTILWGPNGSGKSTLLKVLARLTHCHQGGTPLVTDESLRELRSHNDGLRDGARILTDGKPVHYLDPGAEPGLAGGGAAFDFDFMSDGIQAISARRTSSGEQTTVKTNRILQSAATLKEVPWKAIRPEKYKNPKWAQETTQAAGSLQANIEEDGPPTILFDEPGRSLSIPRQADLWHTLAVQKRFQIIVATHSVFALYALGARYIDVQPGYLEECREELRQIAKVQTMAEKVLEKMKEKAL